MTVKVDWQQTNHVLRCFFLWLWNVKKKRLDLRVASFRITPSIKENVCKLQQDGEGKKSDLYFQMLRRNPNKKPIQD